MTAGGIYIGIGTEVYEICDPELPHEELNAWLDQQSMVQLRDTIRLLLERMHEEAYIGFDAGIIPGAG